MFEIWDILALVWITETIIGAIWKLYELRKKQVKKRASAKKKGVDKE